MLTDVRGLEVTAGSAEAVAHLDDTVGAYLRFGKDTGDHLKAALAADPGFALAHCLKGYFFKLFAVPALESKAKQALADAAAALAERDGTDREHLHLEALAAWTRGDFEATLTSLEAILADHPRDVVALKVANYLHFYRGDSAQVRDSVARTLHAWDEGVAGYSYLLGMAAFGLEESGDYANAERMGRRAVELEPNDPWSVHAVAHVFEMQDRRREGVDWIRDLAPHWSGCNNFAYHLWWHLALCHLELEEYDPVIALYDEQVRSALSDEYLDICNATSLLWRLEERGVDVGGRWEELGERCEGRVDDHLLVFPDAHFLMALAATGRGEALEQMIASLEELAGRGRGTEARVAAEVGVALCRGIAAWHRGDHGACVDHLLPVRYALPEIGGSHAQRDLFAQYLISAALAARRFDLARRLLSERTVARPANPWTWKRYGEALAGGGDDPKARLAQARASQLLGA